MTTHRHAAVSPHEYQPPIHRIMAQLLTFVVHLCEVIAHTASTVTHPAQLRDWPRRAIAVSGYRMHLQLSLTFPPPLTVPSA